MGLLPINQVLAQMVNDSKIMACKFWLIHDKFTSLIYWKGNEGVKELEETFTAEIW